MSADETDPAWAAAVAAGAKLEAEIDALPNSRARSLAKTHAETARLWYERAPKFEVLAMSYAVPVLGRDL